MHRLNGRRSVILLALVLPIVITACSSNSSSGSSQAGGSGTNSSGAGTSAQTPSGSPIKIGFALAETGGLSSLYVPAVQVAQAWAKMVNASGGINGHPVTLDIADTQSSPTAAQAAVTKLVEQDNVDALMVADDSAEDAIAPYLVGKGIAVFGENGSDPTVWGVKQNFFTSTTVAPYTSTAEVVAAKAVGATKIGAMACAEVAACATVGEVLRPTATKLGLSYTGLVTVAASAPNYTAQCLSLMQKGTNTIILAVAPSVVPRIITDCLQQGYKGYFSESASTVNIQSIANIPGVKIAGDLSAFPWWSDAAPVEQFRDAMTKYEPTVNYQSNAATGAWTALALFQKAVSAQTAGNVTRASILNDFYQVKNETLGGLLPQPMTYTQGQAAPVVKAAFVFTYKSGDANPSTVDPATSCNGATDGLSSTCQN